MVITLAAGSSGYPKRLLDLPDPPLFLYASGPLPQADRWVGIVGSRKASEAGRALAERFAKALGERGVGVVSGGALGIDAAAHRGALLGRGPTIVVLPTPVDRPAPKRNWRVFGDVVASGGALVSELSSEPKGKQSFMQRNRIIAALAEAVVVVEAGAISGTRHTVRAARELDRPLGAVPWEDERGSVADEILAAGGTPIRRTGELLEWLSLPRPQPRDETDPILLELGEEAVTVEKIASRIGMPVQRLLAHLTRLELEGRIQVLGGGRIRRV